MAKMMTPGVPDDPAVLVGLAKVAIHHGHLDHALRMMVKSLAGRARTPGASTYPI